MQSHLVALILTLLPLTSAQQLTCVGRPNTPAMATWCNNNCNNRPPFCPAGTCTCTSATSASTSTASRSPSPSPSASPAPPQQLSLTGYYESHTCCVDSDAYAYFVNSGSVYLLDLDANGNPDGAPVLCRNFVNAVDLALDSNGGVYVADFNAATITYIAPRCTSSKLVASWTRDQIPAVNSLAIAADGSLLAGVNPFNVYRLVLDSNRNLISRSIVNANMFWMDKAVLGVNVFVSTGRSILVINTQTWATNLIFDGHIYNVPDIQDVAVTNECGLFFAVPDSHQIWWCSNPMDGSTCNVYCQSANIDSHTCVNTREPWGLALDCRCNLYSTNQGTGELVRYNFGPAPVANTVLLSGLFHPKDVAVFVPTGTCGVSASSSPSVSPSPTSSRSFSPTPSISATSSVSPSSSVSLTASRSPSPSVSTSASVSPSSSVSPTPSVSPSSSTSPSPSVSVTPSVSATASVTSAPSESPSPTSSESASPSVSASPSESASASVSASTSPSPSATRSRTASPSPSPLFTFAMDINDLNQVCVQGSCPEIDETMKAAISDASTNARVVGLITYINHRTPSSNALLCNGGTGGFIAATSTLICSRVATLSEITNLPAALASVKLYIRQSAGLPLPTMTLPFTFLPPLTYPNLYRERWGVFGIIGCTGYAGVDLAVAWTTTRLCWNDSFFGIVVCHVGGTGLNSVDGGGTYVDDSGNVLVPNNPHKKITCVGA